jgi:hypothetical protein
VKQVSISIFGFVVAAPSLVGIISKIANLQFYKEHNLRYIVKTRVSIIENKMRRVIEENEE